MPIPRRNRVASRRPASSSRRNGNRIRSAAAKRAPRRNTRRPRRNLRRHTRHRRNTGAVASVLKRLFPINKYSYNTAQLEQVTGGTLSNELPCKWFVPKRAADVALSYPSWVDMCQVANVINERPVTGAMLNSDISISSNVVKFHTSQYHQVTQLVNNSNSQVVVDCYTCSARRDVPYHQNGEFTTFSILDILGQGFESTSLSSTINSGLDFTDTYQSSSTTGGDTQDSPMMYEASRTPYQSTTFVHYFKIDNTKRVIMNAGDLRQFHLRVSKRLDNTPNQYKHLLASDSRWAFNGFTSELHTIMPRGAKFLLFKITGQAAITNRPEGVAPADYTGPVSTTNPLVVVKTQVNFSYQAPINKGPVTIRASNYNTSAGLLNPVILQEANGLRQAHVNAGMDPLP